MYVDTSGLWVYAVRTLLLCAAFGVFAWSLRASRRQAEQASAQLGARLETALTRSAASRASWSRSVAPSRHSEPASIKLPRHGLPRRHRT